MLIGGALETTTNVASARKVEAAWLQTLKEQAAVRRIQSVRESPLVAYGQALANLLKEMAESPRASAVFGAHQPQLCCMHRAHFYLDPVESRLTILGLPDCQSLSGYRVHLDMKSKPSADIEHVSLWVALYQLVDTDTRMVRRRKTVASLEDAVRFVEGIVADFAVHLEQAAQAELDASMAPKP